MNVTLYPNEHSTGSSQMTADISEFRDCVNSIKVEDIVSSRLFYTWTKNLFKVKSGDTSGVLKKLDRIMGNEEFIDKFPHAHVVFLPNLILIILREKESRILSEYVEAMKVEEKLLFQKAKIKWLCLGDRNNSYFHKVLKSRNTKSRMNQIIDDQGNIFVGEALFANQL
ncbi:hypothetical protein Tco_1008196 [Tanacetum coccineum]